VYDFLIGLLGKGIDLQVSEIHLCADVVGYVFSQCDYEELFVTPVRKNEALFGVDSVALNCHRVATLAFSKHQAPLSSAMYNKTWFYDLWKSDTGGTVWDGESEVWRVEVRCKRQAWHAFQIA
jgi:hypothetical protein